MHEEISVVTKYVGVQHTATILAWGPNHCYARCICGWESPPRVLAQTANRAILRHLGIEPEKKASAS